MEQDIQKLVEVGKNLGLSGEALLTYLTEKERTQRKVEEDRLQREERAAERNAKRVEKEFALQMLEKEQASKKAEKELSLLVWKYL